MKTKILIMFMILCSFSFAMEKKVLEIKTPSMVLFSHDADSAEYKAWTQKMTKGEFVKPHDVAWYNENILGPLVGYTQKKESGAFLTLVLFYREQIGLDKLPVLVNYFLKDPRFENNIYVLSAAGVASLAAGKVDEALLYYDRAKKQGEVFTTVQTLFISALLNAPTKESHTIERAWDIIKDWQIMFAGETDMRVIGADLMRHMEKKGESKYGSLHEIYEALFCAIKKGGFEKILLGKLIAECESINNLPARIAFIGGFANHFTDTPYENDLQKSKLLKGM